MEERLAENGAELATPPLDEATLQAYAKCYQHEVEETVLEVKG